MQYYENNLSISKVQKGIKLAISIVHTTISVEHMKFSIAVVQTKVINYQLPSWETSYFLNVMMRQPRHILRIFLIFRDFQPIYLINFILIKQVWLWPYKAPGIVESGSYDITIECGSKNMSLVQNWIIFKVWNKGSIENKS